MATKEIIVKQLFRIKVDHSIQTTPEEFDAKVNILFDDCKQLTDLQFVEASEKVRKTKELFGKFPKSADFLEQTDLKIMSPEKTALIQVARILDSAKYYYGENIDFGNKTTNAAANMAGGMPKIAHRLEHQDNYLSKELKDAWLACFEGKKEENFAFGRSARKVFIADGERLETIKTLVLSENVENNGKLLN